MAKKSKEAEQPKVESGDLGKKLQEYREEAGYTLDQMAETLHLSPQMLQNLENENFDELPESPYIRGYLRNYARLAETESDELVHLYESLQGIEPDRLKYRTKVSPHIQTESKRNVFSIFAQLFFLSLLVAVIFGISKIPGVNNWITQTWDNFSKQTNTQEIMVSDKPLLTGTMPIPAPLLGENTEEGKDDNTTMNASKPTPTTSSHSTDDVATIPKPENTPVTPATNESTNNSADITTEPAEIETSIKELTNNLIETPINLNTPAIPPVTETTEAQEESNTTAADEVINIKLTFNKEVWMRIRDGDNKTLFEGTNFSGDEKQLAFKKPLTFRVGNASGLALTIDDKPVDITQYTNGSIANFTLK